jgi:hypothetical protein
MTDTAERASKAAAAASPKTPEASVTRNWRYILVMTIVRGVYMPGALAISFDHIVTAGHMFGLTGWQAYTTPAFLDGFALIGMIMRSRVFAGDVRRFGLQLQLGAGVGSLAANVLAGHTVGERVYGALVVAGLVVAELAGERLHSSRSVAKPGRAAVDRAAAARKAAATRAANKAKNDAAAAVRAEQRAAAAEARRLARQVADLEVSYAGPAAPVSGAPIGEAAAYL